ncbi:MAG TPA: tetratricopeptide repeat protein [Phycisphaerae bacterium]|nr:tetratricopeptide repeat protein [Phycisphaerae bacterium]
MTVDQALQLALETQQSGEHAQAEEIFRQILSAYPEQRDALHMLGALLFAHGRAAEGEDLVRRALALAPNEPLFQLTLATILSGTNRAAEALPILERLARDNPNVTDVQLNFGVALSALARHAEAAQAYERALKLAPGHMKAQLNLGITLCSLGRNEEAIWVLRDATRRHPAVADLHATLGAALYQSGQWEAAAAACQEAIRLNPACVPGFHNLCLALTDLGRLEDAAQAAKRTAELLPQFPSVHISYGEAMRRLGDFDACRRAYQHALTLHPDDPDLHNNLGNLLSDQSEFDAALAAYRRAIELRPNVLASYSNLLYTLQFHPTISPDDSFAEHRKFDAVMCEPLRRAAPPHVNDASPQRRLRVGYISTEFRSHALGYYLVPLFANHDKAQIELFAYADVAQPDAVTFRLRQNADRWVDIRGLSDDALAARIREDAIDILVDLHLHMGGNRALLFARKPAPVQIAFAGYPGTTGMTAMDWRLTDRHLEPPEGPAVPSSEKVLRTLETFWCYTPQADVPINDPPAGRNGHVTFGNLNNFKKVNESTLRLWARVMRELPDSRILMLAAHGAHRRWANGILQSAGIDPQRVGYIPRGPVKDYLAAYHQIDLGLDTFPYNGHTTSLDSLWMGVPMVTIVGKTPVSRAGFSQLSNLHLTDLAADSPDNFVAIAAALARDIPRLRELRALLRPRMEASPLMDGPRFAREIESAYRLAWHAWCAQADRASFALPGQWIGLDTPRPW